MTLQELEQVKKDLANGVIVSRETWLRVLLTAINLSIENDSEKVSSR